MPVPYLGNALKGWVKKSNITVVNQSIVDHETVESLSTSVYQANFQPMPAAKVNRKPQEQRTWKWWSVIIRDRTVLLTTDDIIQEVFRTTGKYLGFLDYDGTLSESYISGLISYFESLPPGAQFLRYDPIPLYELGKRFRIEQANDWRESGFTKYEVVEDYS